jgi:hypothetical protein
VPRSLVEFILLGPEDDRRQLQDSPILGDVWVEYAKDPRARLELLITPYKEQAAAIVARDLRRALNAAAAPPPPAPKGRRKGPAPPAPPPAHESAAVAYLQGIVAANLTFEEVLRFVVPMTSWWSDDRIEKAMEAYIKDPAVMEKELTATREQALRWFEEESDVAMQDLPTRKRYAALTGLILWAATQPGSRERETAAPREQSERFLRQVDVRAVVAELKRVFLAMDEKRDDPLVWTISLNRRGHAALTRSVPAVKADAARTLFSVDCSEIVWAVIDSGIDANHYAFRDRKGGKSRVKKAFDFTRIRDIVTLDNLTRSPRRDARVERIFSPGAAPAADPAAAATLRATLTRQEVERHLEELATAADEGRPINWQIVEKLVELKPGASPPATNHGTHVAGILAASVQGARAAVEADKAAGRQPVDASTRDWADGMCPDIQLYDFRVLAPTLKETEFAIIAALQYIRYINERNSYMTIHGANLSLSIPHDVRNYACGRTPVCNECERLVNSGVVVVAAAGNRGYQNFETTEGLYEGYAAFSVTDPGNADGVITVGATHRYWPHTYGVSFFSSRGPTGDGRQKPDLVAPGERIRAPIPDNLWSDLDGTSMASPHVSGAAAMLMARYSEMVGQPRRIKQVLCQSTTDLGREKSFQGHGMLDVLRAFQSI